MFKLKKFNNLNSQYSKHLYKGLKGFFMKMSHNNLENFESKKKISKVLEIGAGSMPHYNFIEHNYEEYHILEVSKVSKKYIKKEKNIFFKLYNGSKIPYENNTFDRIIICHCLEHIVFPEIFIDEMMSKLKKKGILSISLPCDPGLAWRISSFLLGKRISSKTYKINSKTINYLNAIEHVNSVFNLISIIKYKFNHSIKESYLPFYVKNADLNLFYNVHIYKK